MNSIIAAKQEIKSGDQEIFSNHDVVTSKDIDLSSEIEWYDIRTNLLSAVSRKVSSTSNLANLVDQVVQMTQRTLKASASSVLLYDEVNDELYFDVATGKAGKALKHVRISAKSGIAGWVFQHGKPLVVNDVAEDKRFNTCVDSTTGFQTKSILCVPLTVHRKTIGVLEVLNKTDGSDFSEDDLAVLMSVATTAAISIENTQLHQAVLDGYKSTIKGLAAAVDAKDPYTCGHSNRVMEYAVLGGISLSLSQEELVSIENAAILHDIGKIGIADSILRKPGPLNPEELTIMRQHASIGANIIKDIPFLEEARMLVLHHHERYDGTGYPANLKGTDIPLGARLLAVADTFDTMITDRSYRSALDMQYALHELHRCSGTQFCPDIVEAFISSFLKKSKDLKSHTGS